MYFCLLGHCWILYKNVCRISRFLGKNRAFVEAFYILGLWGKALQGTLGATASRLKAALRLASHKRIAACRAAAGAGREG